MKDKQPIDSLLLGESSPKDLVLAELNKLIKKHAKHAITARTAKNKTDEILHLGVVKIVEPLYIGVSQPGGIA